MVKSCPGNRGFSLLEKTSIVGVAKIRLRSRDVFIGWVTCSLNGSLSLCNPQSVSEVEMWKRKQRRVGNSQESGQPKPSTSFIWCEHGGCCTCLWDADKKLISGSQHFEVILRCPVARDVFKEFLQSEYSEENLMFWIACEDLKNETDPSTIAEKARKIYEDYISVSSLKEVNLDSQIRNDISQSLEEPSSMMYEEAQHQIYNLMRRDSFPRFLKSSLYRDLLNSKNQSASTMI
ncbi:regulator of G-protein signaling 17 [Labeo rohita]|uniref:regulator of G-protein signaling 17 n=1 Tax=Labeo rohita TaxID=84645 RepID=UPI0021E2BAC3|nr:regulator of G-protein signaling 17 [Labeo rohita]